MEIQSLLRRMATLPISCYQLAISPWLPPRCIYTPSCSEYTRQAIMKHGLLRGTPLAAARIFRCVGSVYEGGFDPVPESISCRIIGEEYARRFKLRRNRDSMNKDSEE